MKLNTVFGWKTITGREAEQEKRKTISADEPICLDVKEVKGIDVVVVCQCGYD